MGAIERVAVLENQMSDLKQQMEQLETLLARFTKEINTLHERISHVQARIQAMHSLNMRGIASVDEKKE